jgi:hypothetical protein
MRALGIMLLVAGVLALVYQGFTYRKQDTLVEFGGVEAKVVHNERVIVPPIAGAAAVAAGVALVFAARRRTG